ncbi:MAG: HTH domain-containing protein [Dehalococcoidia bacterium]
MKKEHQNGWYLWSSHGTVLFFVAVNPACTIQEIADGLSLTPRTIWGVIGDLRRAGMLEITKDGRRHRYSVNLDAPFRHPTIRDVTLRTLLAELPAAAQRQQLRATVAMR